MGWSWGLHSVNRLDAHLGMHLVLRSVSYWGTCWGMDSEEGLVHLWLKTVSHLVSRLGLFHLLEFASHLVMSLECHLGGCLDSMMAMCLGLKWGHHLDWSLGRHSV